MYLLWPHGAFVGLAGPRWCYYFHLQFGAVLIALTGYYYLLMFGRVVCFFCLYYYFLSLFCFVIIIFLFFFLSLLFLGCVCALHCSGGLCLEVVVVVFAGFRAFVGGKIAFMIGDCCVHPEAFDKGCSIWKEKVFGTVFSGIDFGVYTGFERFCAGLVVAETAAPY
jgi:hypothetical protein